MSRSYNSVTLLGNVAGEPIIKQTSGGKKYALFSLACGYDYKDSRTGQSEHGCDFIPCTAFGAVAGVIESYVNKGKQIMVNGELKVRKYQDSNTGENKTSINVNIKDLLLLGGGQGGGQATTGHEKTHASMSDPDNGGYDAPEDDNSPEAQIPF